MRREEYLQEIAKGLFEASEDEKEAKKRREYLRDEFFRLAEAEFHGKDHILPVKTIEVPDEFFARTGLTKDEFVKSRFPGWKVEHCEKNVAMSHTVFVFKKDPSYIPTVVDVEVDDQSIRVAKEIAEFTPEIDWDTLRKERPDLFKKLARRKVVYELNDQELENLTVETPEDLATLERHLKVKEPVRKATAKRLKNERETLK